MKIFITAPFDDDGIEEVDIIDGPFGNYFSYEKHGLITTVCGFYKEGETWHRARETAVLKAREFRQARIAKLLSEAQDLSAMPVIE